MTGSGPPAEPPPDPGADDADGRPAGRRRLDGLLRRLDRARLADGTMLALAAAVGVLTGALAAALIGLVDLVVRLAWGDGVEPWELFAVPVGGALLVAGVARAAPQVLGSGIVTTMEALVLGPGRLRPRTALGTVLASGVALGTGASGGREAPIVLVGGAVGSTVGRIAGLAEQEVRSLVAAGAAAGVGASFNAPIGGMLFAIEVIVGGLRSRTLQVVVVSSVAGSVVARQLVGEGLVYRPLVRYRLEDPRELVTHLLVGLACGLLAVLLVAAERPLRRLAAPLERRFGAAGPLVVGALVLGVVGLLVPQVLGDGDTLPPVDGVRRPIQQLIDGGYGTGTAALATIGVLVLAKLVATWATQASRTALGTFAPMLFLGAGLGSMVGTIAVEVAPGFAPAVGSTALVGMAAAFGAAARAPLTAVLIVFELSGDYALVLPLMLGVGVATWLADRTTDHSVFTRPLADRGVVHAEPDDVDLLQTVRVEEVMTVDHPTVRPDLPLSLLRRRFDTEATHGMAVVADGRVVGVVTLGDLRRVDALLADGVRPASSITVADVMTADPVTVAPGDEVFRALRRMAALDVGRVPVATVDGTLVGLLRRGDVVEAYRTALGRTARTQAETERARLRDVAGLRFVELSVAPGSAVDGATVADVAWPTSVVVTSLRRGSEVLVPRGDTALRAGDELVVVAAVDAVDGVRGLLAAGPDVPGR